MTEQRENNPDEGISEECRIAAMSHDDVRSFWGDQNLRQWPLESLRDVAIPEASKAFLALVGLPLHNDWTLRFDEQAGDLARLSG